MPEFAKQLLPVNIEDEMKRSYVDYAMSVIVGRALPDVRDGLKPVHRRVLYAMHSANNVWNRPFVKCARVVGEVLGKFHPHGDTATYDALARMVQEFSLRYPLIEGQGNFGSVDGDPPAAYRYTECRLMRISDEMLADIDRETVDFVPNYDGKETEPTVLPTRIPNLLVNGSSGIAVGMATNIPPHNLGEVTDACIALLDDPSVSIEALMQHVPAPDFPTAGIIMGVAGIRDAYLTGRGPVTVRGRVSIESDKEGDQPRLVVSELPYQVNKARLLTQIADLVKDKKIEGIRELRDESDKDGMRVVVELRRGEVPEVVLNNLYQHTQLQTVFHVNTVALVDGQPRTLDLKQLLECFLRHRREVVVRRTLYDLGKSRERAHKLEGLAVALANIDPIIELIKAAPSPIEARAELMARTFEPGTVTAMLSRSGAAASRPMGLAPELGLVDGRYRLSEVQAQEILDLRLQRLTALEKDKIFEEYASLLDRIGELRDILDRPERLSEVIRAELIEVKARYGDRRRTEVQVDHREMRMEDLITEEDVVVTLSHAGYAKAQPVDAYRSQRRGGRGRTATSMREEDFLEKVFVASTHDTLLCFSTRGKAYWIKVYELPQAGPTARGKPIVNLLRLTEGERITAVLPLREYRDDAFIFMATRFGTVKKVALADFSRPRSAGIIAIDLPEDDLLVDVVLTDGSQHVMLFSSAGKVNRFSEDTVRVMGRNARGVRGIRLGQNQTVIALVIAERGSTVLTATANGYGKRTPIDDYPPHGRGGQGVISIQTTERNGNVIGAVAVQDDNEIMLISDAGTLVRTPVRDISILSRNTQGVTLIQLSGEERLVGLARIVDDGGEESGADDDSGPGDEPG